jgi:hypothetical protein
VGKQSPHWYCAKTYQKIHVSLNVLLRNCHFHDRGGRGAHDTVRTRLMWNRQPPFQRRDSLKMKPGPVWERRDRVSHKWTAKRNGDRSRVRYPSDKPTATFGESCGSCRDRD